MLGSDRSAVRRNAFSRGLALVPSLLALALVLLRWQLAPPQPYVLDLGDVDAKVSHFYAPESAEDRGFRWSKPLSALSMPALAMHERVSLVLNPARPLGAPAPRVVLFSNGAKAADFALTAGWNPYTATVSPGTAPDLRLVLESDSFYPGSGDNRRLGVAASAVRAEALQGPAGLFWPPLLWLVLAVIAPLAPRLVRRSWDGLTRAAAYVAAAGVAAFSLLPSQAALPLSAWIAGAILASGILSWSYRALEPGSRVRDCVERLARSRWELPLVAAASAVLSVPFTWPLAKRISTSVPGWPADNFAFLYKLWWFRTSVLEVHRQPFFDPNTFAPFGFNLGQGEPTLANTVPGILIGALANDVAAYNLLALSSFVVSALGAYLLVRETSGSRGAALFGGLAFAFCPYRMSQLGGHLQLLGTGWIALSFYFVEKTWRTRALRDGALAGVFLGIAGLSAWYYAYMAGLLLAVYALVRFMASRAEVPARLLVRPAVATAVGLAVVALPAALPSLSLWEQGGLSHTAKAADEHSAAPVDFVLPNPLHPVWGEPFMRAHADQNVIESSLYAGLVVAALAAAAFAGRAKPRRGLALAWTVVLGVSLILALGLTLHDTSGQVQFSWPGGQGPVPLPGQLLFDWLPLYSSMRAYARFGIIAMLALTVLAGLGLAFMGRRWPKLGPWLVLVLCAAMLVDFATTPYAWGTSRVFPSRTAQYLAAAAPGTIMQMPLESALTGPALYAETSYGKPVAYGYDTFEPAPWRAARPLLSKFPSEGLFDLLRSWGVRYIVVSANAYGPYWSEMLARLEAEPRLAYLAGFEEDRVWDVDPQVLDARPDMEQYALPESTAIFELRR